MKVLFLDIDGVMNSRIFYKKRHSRRWFKLLTYWYIIKSFFYKIFKITPKSISIDYHNPPSSHYTFEYQFNRLKSETCKEKWDWLSSWCNKTDTKICISSVWKHHFGTEDHKSTPEKWEDALKLLGFKPNTFVGITGKRRTLRGQEIQDWLDKHPEVVDYAILDDDMDMLNEQFDKFHHCDSWYGLSPGHLYRIERQFNKLSN